MRLMFYILLLLAVFSAAAVANDPPAALNVRMIIIDGATNQEVARTPITGDKLKAGYTFDDPDGDTELNSTLKWYKNGFLERSVTVSGEQGRILADPISRGEAWHFTITPRDGQADGEARASSPVMIGNAPPKVTSATISPTFPGSKDDLQAVYNYSDPEGDEEGSSEIRWYKLVDGSYSLQPFQGKVLPASATLRGDRWRYSVRPRDLFGASPDNFTDSSSVEIQNAIPHAEIISVTGAKDENGYFYGDITVIYDLTDGDGDLCDVRLIYRGGTVSNTFSTAAYAVEAGGRNAATNIQPGAGLTLTWRTTEDQPAEKADNYRIGVRPDDGADTGNEALWGPLSIDNNSAPEVTDVSISPQEPFSSDDLIANYTFLDDDGDEEMDSVIKWYRNGDEQPGYRNLKEVSHETTVKGEEWYFTIEPSDGKEPGEMQTASRVVIQNSPPEALDVTLTPSSPTSDDHLEASYTYSDADGDVESGTRIRWYKNGLEQLEHESKTSIHRDNTDKGDEWYFTVLVHDGTVPGQIVTSNQVVVGNMPPEIRSLNIPPEGFRDVAIKFDLVDADDDLCSLEVEYRGGNAGLWAVATIRESLTDIEPNNLITLTWASAEDEDVRKPTNFQIRITPNDGFISGETVISGFFTLDNNEAPIATDLQILPSEPTSIDNLEASYVYTDPDGSPEVGSEIIWYKNDMKTDSKGRILTASATLRGQTWYYTVKPKDGSKFGEMKTSPSATILNLSPFVRDVVLVPANPGSGDTLTVQYDYRDLDEDRENGTVIEWFKNGVLEQTTIVETDQDRKLPIPILKGERWYAVVTPRDGIDFGEPVTSNSVAVGNAVPVVEDVVASGGAGQANITYALIDTDGDLCNLTVEYQGGSVQGAAWAPATIDEPITNISPGTELQLTWRSDIDEPGQSANNYKIRITPNDGLTKGISGLSPSFSFSNNSAPTATGVLILPENPLTSEALVITYVFIDPDGDIEAQPEIKWYRNGFEELKYNSLKTLPAIATKRGERWYYTIRVNDGKEYGRLQTSRDVVIRNAPPEAINIILSPDQPGLDDQLVAHYTYDDADGDLEAGTIINWYRQNVHRAEFDGFTIIPSAFTLSGDEWYFTVMPRDGLDFGTLQSSNKVFIDNKPPVASGLSVSPPAPLTTDDLQASYVYNDPEKNPESGSKIIWYKNDVRQSKYDDTLILPAAITAKNQIWHFTVQPRDGKQFGIVQKSASIFIANTPPRVENPAVSPPYPLSKDDLFAAYDFIDVDGDSEGRSEVKWYRNDIWIPEYSGRQLPARATSDGEMWHFKVKPKDDVAFGAELTAEPVEIGSPIPRVNSLTIVPNAPLTTDALIASYIYVDPRNIPESGSQISWYRNGAIQPSYAEKILPQEATSKGEQWYFSVAPSNGSQIGEEQSSIPVTIINSPPTLTNVIMLPNAPTTDDDMVIDYIFEDADGDVEAGNEIKWYRNGILQAAYSNMTELPASVTTRGEDWYFTIRSRDDNDFSNLATAPTVTIGNGRPMLVSLDVLPVDPLTDSELGVVYSYVDTESDPEIGTEIRWFRNDLHETDYDDLDVVPADATARDDSWHCTVRPNDGLDFGEVYTSPVLVIGNTAPVAIEIIASSDQVIRGDSVEVISQGQDADLVDNGAALTCQISLRFGAGAWEELPTEYVEEPESGWVAVFAPDPRALLGEYDFRSRFTDAAGGESNWIERENMITVVNRTPEIDASADNFHVSEDAVRDFDLRSYGSDLEDGETLTWGLDPDSVDESLFQATISGNRYLEIQPMDNKNGQDDITIMVTDTDGSEFVKTDVTIIIDPVNDPPGVPTSVRITPASPKTSDSLTCEASGSIDPDEGSVVVYRYQWYKDDVLQPNLTSKTVPQSRTSKDELWRCEVIPSDGLIDGLSRSAEITVVNTLPEVAVRNTDGDTRNIVVTFDLQDLDNDDCDLKVEYRIKGKTWKSANIVESLRGVKTGTGLTLTWQSHLDVPDLVTDDCRLRVTPNDGVLPGTPGESAGFPLDNLAPEFTVTAISNPIHSRYIDVTVVSDEELSEIPDVSVNPGEDGESIKLDMEEVADTSWTGMFVLEPGFNAMVTVVVEGVDLVGNVGQSELQKEFNIPSPVPRPTDFALEQNYPNPFSKNTNIPYQLPESSNVTIDIYSLTGKLVRSLDEGYKVAGFYLIKDKTAYWDGRDDNGNLVASGIYFYCLRAGSFSAVRKMSVVR